MIIRQLRFLPIDKSIFGIALVYSKVKAETMQALNNVNSLTELLELLRVESRPMFVNLCSRCGNEHFLTDQVVSNLQAKYSIDLGYEKLPPKASAIIKAELQISKNPVLLLIKDGAIKSLFGGMVAQYKLEQALEELQRDQPLHAAGKPLK